MEYFINILTEREITFPFNTKTRHKTKLKTVSLKILEPALGNLAAERTINGAINMPHYCF